MDYPGAVLQSVCRGVPMCTASSKVSVAISRLPSHVVLSTFSAAAGKLLNNVIFFCNFVIFSRNIINVVVSVLVYPLFMYHSGMSLVNRDPIACLFL